MPGGRRAAAWLPYAFSLLLLASALTGCGGGKSRPGGGYEESPAKVAVPPLGSKSVEEARAALQEAGLAPGSLAEEFSETVPAGYVIRTEPPSGEEVEMGTSVQLVVSKGTRPKTIPDLRGKAEQEALAILQSLGLEVDVQRTYTERVPQGTVVSTEPAPGTSLAKGQHVTLTVSSGPAYVTCSRCGGRGTVTISEMCPDCGGTGTCYT